MLGGIGCSACASHCSHCRSKRFRRCAFRFIHSLEEVPESQTDCMEAKDSGALCGPSLSCCDIRNVLRKEDMEGGRLIYVMIA